MLSYISPFVYVAEKKNSLSLEGGDVVMLRRCDVDILAAPFVMAVSAGDVCRVVCVTSPHVSPVRTLCSSVCVRRFSRELASQ